MKRIVGVQFESKFNPGTYCGREYSYYEAEGLSLEPGDIVTVPVGTSEGNAMVSRVNIPESKVDMRVLPILKTITKPPISRANESASAPAQISFAEATGAFFGD